MKKKYPDTEIIYIKNIFDTELLDVNVFDVILNNPNSYSTESIKQNLTQENPEYLLKAKIKKKDKKSLEQLMDLNFEVMGSQTELLLTNYNIPDKKSKDIRIISNISEYNGIINDLAITGSQHAALYSNPNIPNNLVEKYYRQWAVNNLTGRASNNFIYYKDEKPLALISTILKSDANNNLNIDFVETNPNFRNKGIASATLTEVIRYGFENELPISVVTESKNTPALNLYKKYGFKISDEYHILHKYVSEKGG